MKPCTSTGLAAVILGCALLAGCAFGAANLPVAGDPAATADPSAGVAATETVFAMSTVMELTAHGPGGADAVARAGEKLTQLDALLSTTNPNSEVYAINHSAGGVNTLSADTAFLLAQAVEIAQRSGGALDVTIYPVVQAWGFTTGEYHVLTQAERRALLKQVDYTKLKFDAQAGTLVLPEGMALDFGSIAKGYAGDEVMDIFRSCGVTSGLINLGGNVQTLGSKPDGSNWNIAVRDPRGGDYAGVVAVSDCAVITSGGYERSFEAEGETYWHIIDPATGAPVRNGVISVTVVGPSGVLCDGLSTTLFILGQQRAAEYWRTYGGFEFIMMTEEGELLVTQGLKDSFTPAGDWAHAPMTVIEE